MGKALWKLVENAARFPRRGGAFCASTAPSASTGPVRVGQDGSQGPVNNYVHVKTADLYRPNARLTPERQGYQVLTPFGKLGYSLISDLSAFIGHSNPTKHRILAAGDLNMFYGATGSRWSLPERDGTVWDRMQALGLEFLGPQVPHGRSADAAPDDVPSDTKNVPTFYRPGGRPGTAVNQLDYAFASRGFHERVSVRAMNGIAEWGPSDHCRLMIEMKTKQGLTAAD